MGTDIHLTIEARSRVESYPTDLVAKNRTRNPDWMPAWSAVAKAHESKDGPYAAQFRLRRDYYLFMLLAGVRRHRFEQDCTMFEPRGVPADVSYEVCNWISREGDDGHTHSWLTLSEMEQVYQRFVDTDIECGDILRFGPNEEIVIPDGWVEDTVIGRMSWPDGPVRTAVGITNTVARKDAPRKMVDVITDIDAIMAMMCVYERDGEDARVVFFFDN